MRTTGKTRDRIMKAAFEEFTEKGYDRTKTGQIAERASVNEVTIFRQFGSKERLFTTVIENGIRNGMIAVARIEPGDDVIEDLTEIGISVARSMMTNARFTKLISDEYHNIHPMLTKVMSDAYFEMVDAICQYLYKAIEKGTIRNINADLAAIMFFSYFYRYLIASSFRKDQTLIEMDRQGINNYVRLFVHGLMGDERA